MSPAAKGHIVEHALEVIGTISLCILIVRGRRPRWVNRCFSTDSSTHNSVPRGRPNPVPVRYLIAALQGLSSLNGAKEHLGTNQHATTFDRDRRDADTRNVQVTHADQKRSLGALF